MTNTTSPADTLAGTINAMLKEKGVKKTWLANKIGISREHLWMLLNGKRNNLQLLREAKKILNKIKSEA